MISLEVSPRILCGFFHGLFLRFHQVSLQESFWVFSRASRISFGITFQIFLWRFIEWYIWGFFLHILFRASMISHRILLEVYPVLLSFLDFFLDSFKDSPEMYSLFSPEVLQWIPSGIFQQIHPGMHSRLFLHRSFSGFLWGFLQDCVKDSSKSFFWNSDPSIYSFRLLNFPRDFWAPRWSFLLYSFKHSFWYVSRDFFVVFSLRVSFENLSRYFFGIPPQILLITLQGSFRD